MNFAAFLMAASLGGSASPAPQCATMFEGDKDRILEHIWQKEMAIYQGRANADLSYYLSNTSDNFLAWTAGTPKPYNKQEFSEKQKAISGNNKEIITTKFDGFTLSGNTAVIYYTNHRTRLPDGKIVDQKYDNIHVWINEDCSWNVFASMSRPAN